MTTQSLPINLQATGETSTAQKRWVSLTQPVENGMDTTASMYDIAQMIARARSGNSAFTYKKDQCSAGVDGNGNVNVRLDFKAWPSFPSLAYTVESSFGAISAPVITEEYTEFSVIFQKSDAVELDFILKNISQITWETDCYDLAGNKINSPDITVDGLTTLRTETKIFGVARIRGQKYGAQHRVTATLIKSLPVRPENPLPDAGVTADMLAEYWAYTDIQTWNGEPVNAAETVDMTGLHLDNLAITVTAKWINTAGEEESASMRLTIPQCVQDLLAACDGNLENFNGSNGGGETGICNLADRESHLTVYTSGCTGDVLDKRTTVDDPDSWCE